MHVRRENKSLTLETVDAKKKKRDPDSRSQDLCVAVIMMAAKGQREIQLLRLS